MIRLIANSRYSCSSLKALSPLDGRYNASVKQLQDYLSEMAFMKYRIKVESSWLIHLMKHGVIKTQKNGPVPTQQISELEQQLGKLVDDFGVPSARRIKQIQKRTNHDLKSVEYFMKKHLAQMVPLLAKYQEYIHFCCTSEDINNLSYALMLKDALNTVMIPKLQNITNSILEKSKEWADHAMVARTHGQSATPTTIGKQFANFGYRLSKQLKYIRQVQLTGKINGAVGNYNAHYFVYPQHDWISLNKQFVEKNLQLQFNPYTTQIQSHDTIARVFGEIALSNTILIGFSRDIWEYVSKGYLKQKTVEGEVGSSTMPHKVNPIDFENAEGNLGLANSMMQHFSQKLPISRQQRDLSDSTVLRNQGSALGYSLMAYKSLSKGMSKIDSNRQLMKKQLSEHHQVITEAIQTQLRKIGYAEPYQLLKELSRGRPFTKDSQEELIYKLEGKIPKESLEKIKRLKPEQYLGKASQLANDALQQSKKWK